MRKTEVEKELRKAKKARDAYHAQYLTLRDAVKSLYYAAYWHPDRAVPETLLWETVRDAAKLPKGATRDLLGPDRSGCVACEMSAINDPRCSQMEHTCKR